MENRELKEYLAEFADNAPVSIIMANPKKRRLLTDNGRILQRT